MAVGCSKECQGAYATPITSLRVSVRSANCLSALGIETLGELASRSEAELMSTKNLGVKSLEELRSILGDNGLRFGMAPSDLAAMDRERSGGSGPFRPVLPEGLGALGDLLAAAREFRRAGTLRSALEEDLGGLADAMGIGEQLKDIELDSMTGGRRLSDSFLAVVDSFCADLTHAELLILQERLYRLGKPATLQALGDYLGVTRERVRQVERRLKERIPDTVGEHVRMLAGALAVDLEPVLPTDDLDRRLEGVFAGADSAPLPVAVGMLREAVDYRRGEKISLSPAAVEVVQTLKAAARELQDDAGLVEETPLQGVLPDEGWVRFWPLLVEECGFHRIDGLLGLRNTRKARVKAAVLNIGRVASKEEIAERCGLPATRVSAYLSAFPSVVRANMTDWGLLEWVEDEYDGVAGEILQRIDEDGGATSVERLYSELWRLFQIGEPLVRSYLNTPQFEVLDGYVRRADTTALKLRMIDDVVHGRDDQGRPYWRFKVKEEHFEGYGIRIPAEVARELGCEPNQGVKAHVAHPRESAPVSVVWQLATIGGGAHLGRLANPLTHLEASAGETVRVVLCGSNLVELRSEPVADAPEVDPGGTAAHFLERLKNRRKVL